MKRDGLWRNHDFLVLWTGGTVSALGSSMSFFVFPLLGFALTGSAPLAALAGSAHVLGQLVFRLPAGVLVDRWPRKRVLVGADLACATLYGALALGLTLGAVGLAGLVVTALLTGVAGSFSSPAEAAAIKSVVPREQLPTAFSQKQARAHAAQLAGPPLGGLLYGAARAWPFLFDAVSYLGSAVATARIRHPLLAPRRENGDAAAWRSQLTEGIRYLWGRGFLRAIVLFAMLFNFAGSALFFVVTLKLLAAGVHPAAIGVVDAIAATAGLLGSVLAPLLIRRIPTGRITLILAPLIAVLLIPVAFTDSPVVVGALLASGLLVNPAANAAILSYLVATVPDRLQGRTQAALGLLCDLPVPLAPIAAGWAMQETGAPVTVLGVATLIALSVAPLLASRDVRTLGTPDRWPTASPAKR